MAFCSSCGAKLEDVAKFCPVCGKAREIIGQAAASNQSVENSGNQQVAQIETNSASFQQSQNIPENINVQYQNTNPQQPEGYIHNPGVQTAPSQYYTPISPKKSKAPLIVAIVVVVILALGIGGFFTLKNVFSGLGGGAKTQIQAAQNVFKAIDNQNVDLFIKTIDYEGRFKDLDSQAKSKGKSSDEFMKQLQQMIKELDSQLEEEYGVNWSNKVTYKIEGNPEVDGDYKYHTVIATMEGEDSDMDVVSPVKGNGWYVVFDEVYGQIDSFLNE
jgi:hypothetical protein